MPFVPVVNAARVEVRFTWNLQRVENTLWFLKSAPIGVGDIEILIADVRDHWIANMIPLQPNEVQLSEVFGRDYTNDESYEATVNPAAPTFGTYGNNALPNNVTISLKLGTGLAGRANRGRNYWIGLIESEVTQNTVSASFITAITAAYATMIGFESVSAGWTWVVVSFQENGVVRASGQSLSVTSVNVADPIIDSQRRRLPGRGR